MEFIASLIAGAVGGNIAGMAVNRINQGTLINSVAGIVGGGLGGQILSLLGAGTLGAVASAGGAFDPTVLAGQMASGGVGGAVVLAVVGVIRNALGR